MRVLSVLLLSALAPSISAVPAGSSITSPPPLQPIRAHASDPRRPWTRMRDWVIESVWGIRSSPSCHKNGGPPSNVRDRYESDVVLRFQLRDSAEAEALAAASQALVLDIWAITSEYVDIRLAREMVYCPRDQYSIDYLLIPGLC